MYLFDISVNKSKRCMIRTGLIQSIEENVDDFSTLDAVYPIQPINRADFSTLDAVYPIQPINRADCSTLDAVYYIQPINKADLLQKCGQLEH